MTPLLLCSAAFLTLPGASFAQTTQDQAKQPGAQSQQAPAQQAPAATQPQTQGQAQQPSQNRNAQTPQGSGQQQTQSPTPSGTQTTQQPQQGGAATQQQTQTPRSTQQPSTAQQPSTTRQPSTAQQPSTTQQPSTAQQPSTRQQPSTAQRPSAPGQAGTTTATLTDQQRTKISSSISQANVQPVRNVNFSVNVGTVVPSSVRFYPVTRAMIDVYPQFRGYHFMVVNEEIVIVEPRARKIVQVIPHQGGGGQATLRSKLKLSDKQRNVIRSSVRRSSPPATTGATTTVEEIEIGDTLPETVVIERFPDTVYREVPSVRSYQYITRDRGVYVVDPRERRVIDLID
jgi:hypothetical protein